MDMWQSRLYNSLKKQSPKKKRNGISSFCNTASQVINGMTFSEKVHTALDVVGMVPVLGEVCDATNAVIYLMEGNLGEAAMSGAACIPGWGNAATAAKMAGKASTASKAAKTATDTLTNKTVSETLQDLYKGMAGIFTGGATADAAKAYDKMKDAGNGLDGIHDAQKAADKAGTAGKTAKKADGAGGKSGTGSDLDGIRIINKKYAGKTYEFSGDLATKYPNGVKFSNEGFPDFEPYSIKKVTVDNLEGDAYNDFIKANEAAGYSSTPTGFTWHHVEDGRTMLLVPSDLHGAVRHTGGASLIRKGIRP